MGQRPGAVVINSDPPVTCQRVDDRLLARRPLPAVAGSLGLVEIIELLVSVKC